LKVLLDGSSPALVVTPPSMLPRPETTMTEEQEAQLCLVAEDPTAAARLAALRVLRTRLERPRVRELADKLRATLWGSAFDAVSAAGALGELRDARAVPDLIDVLSGPDAVSQTAARALLEIAQQDFRQSKKKWLAWWESHKTSDRVDWLLDGLAHKSPEIRFSSSEELRLITGEYFGYHFDLPKREREEARERWQKWWQETGRERLALGAGKG
jgi:HEAT repeat protein